MKTALRRPAVAMRGRPLRSSCTARDRRCSDASRGPVQSSTDRTRDDGFPTAGAPVATVAPVQAPYDGARAAHSRFVQRIRRRYAGELALLPPGLPDRDAIAALVERLQRRRPRRSPRRCASRASWCSSASPCSTSRQARRSADITRAMTELAEATLELALAQALRRPGRALRRAARRRRRARSTSGSSAWASSARASSTSRPTST